MKTSVKVLLRLLLLLALPAAVQAQFTFTTNNGTITITGYTGPGGDVTIPSWTNGYPRGQPLHSEARSAQNAPESTIGGVLPKR